MADPSTLNDAPAASKQAPLGFQLVVMTNQSVSAFPLPSTGNVTLGRGEGSDIRIDDPRVSRQHLRLYVSEEIEGEDLGTANGTFLGGQRLEANKRVRVLPGEAIAFGASIAIVQPQHGSARSEPALVDESGPGSAELPPGIVLADDRMRQLYELAARAARSSINVLIFGETGAGKDFLAQTVHYCSARKPHPLVTINCAALSETLLESELFGHERGAFTGAIQAKAGLLESATGGTIFLDEVGELSATTQATLLRVLETREVTRLGSVKPRRIDVRFVSATNRNLARESSGGTFRRDLYFRLNGLTLAVPPLRERPSEIVPLARRFALAAWATDSRAGRPTFSQRALERLAAYAWPGNIRELRNVVERALILSDGQAIDAEHLIFETSGPPVDDAAAIPGTRPVMDVRSELAELERQRIVEALERFGGNQTRAAQHLGVPRRTFVKRLDEYGLSRPRKPGD